METQPSRSQATRSLAATLAIAFFTLSAVMLLVSSGLQIFSNMQTLQTTISRQQQSIAQDAALRVENFIQEKFSVLDAAVKLANPVTGASAAQQQTMDSLLGAQPAFRRLILLNVQDKVLVETSRLSQAASGHLIDHITGDILAQVRQGQRYASPVYIDDVTSEPMIVLVVPATSAMGDFEGTLAAEVNLKFMWDLVDQLKVGNTGRAYVVDRQGTLLAFGDIARVLKSENVKQLHDVEEFVDNPTAEDENEANLHPGITGATVMSTHVPLGTPDWAVVTEMPWEEAYQPVIVQAAWSLGITLAMAVLAGLLGVVVARQLAVPLVNLTETATRIAGGEMSLQAAIGGAKEVASLAAAFNNMTAQLRQLLGGLEQRVAERTEELSKASDNLSRRVNQLQVSSEVSRVATTLMDPEELIHQVADLIRKQFDFYYVGLFLVDADSRYAGLQYGTGEAGRTMKEAGHRLEIGGESMVGWACANRQARIALDVGQEAVRFANPLLPDTHSEMALPLQVGGRMIGALDVQSEQTAAFDESDVMVLQAMADQVAVALTNAQLFEQAQRRAVELTTAKEAAEGAKDEAEKARHDAEAEKEKAETANETLAAQMWQTAGQALLNERMRGEQDIPTLSSNVIQQLCKYLGAQVGALYAAEDGTLKLAGSYAYTRRKNLSNQFQIGEGMVGQAAFEKQPIVITNVPGDYIAVTSGLGETPPRNILVAPFTYDGQVVGVVELGTLAGFDPAQMEFLDKVLESVAIAFTTAQARVRVNELLTKTQQQAEELQAQEEELRAANEELESQTESLRTSEAKLKANQAELEEANAGLEESSAALREREVALDRQNQDLKAAQQELERKAEELALASKYKSEFLANMSHELRTPLNSLLILAGMLAKNESGNLTPDQVESAEIIYSGGTDLLKLINDILDLSKVEAGKMEFHLEPMPLERLVSALRAQFGHVAQDKDLAFEITLGEGVPEAIETDQQRVEQIVKNMLSNAFKFTEQGSVRLDICRPQSDTDLSRSGLDPARAVAIGVTDTGIGMTLEQQQIVFEAFQQADGSTSRQYGGTGLGLAISRELAIKLGGQIDLVSEVGKGSTFTLYLPVKQTAAQGPERQAVEAPTGKGGEARKKTGPLPSSPPEAPGLSTPPSPKLPDDRDDVQAGDRVLLVVEDDAKFARVVYNYAHKKGFKCLLAPDGETGLELARHTKADAIVLDLNLPGMSGWEVLDVLKHNADTRHIPVHIMSVADEDLDAYKRGAMGFLTKPTRQKDLDGAFLKIEEFIARKIKSLLLVEDDAHLRKSVRKLLEGSDVTITEASLGAKALEQLAAQHFDCMILDLSLPDMSGFELLNRLNADEALPKCPIIVYTGKALSEEENRELLKYADSVIVKGAKSPERLLDETALFLHRVIADMPEEKQRTIKRMMGGEAVLAGKEIMIVDDDARNAFALSKLLAERGIKVHIAVNGQKALEMLNKTPVDLVLMDIMLPGMDGYEITRRIRAQERFRHLPILALTAKAMKGDREKCIAAGASDYLSKPVDAERLFSMLRVWLSQD